CIIKRDMRRFSSLLIVLLLSSLGFAGVVGVFQGRIVRPSGAKVEDGILYIRARNGMARKVRVEKAVIEYDEDVPKSQRGREAAKSLCDETLVRVTAEQSDREDGEWKALNILILPDPALDSKADGRLKQASFRQARPGGSGSKDKSAAISFCAPQRGDFGTK
ncbi:MAG TPA: hypothetical protein VMZ25_03155, partial [Terriglobales bacterium]|nr:hypothetical protein [Terriglobales bacterium]